MTGTISKTLTPEDLQLLRQAFGPSEEDLKNPGVPIHRESQINRLFVKLATAAGGNPDSSTFRLSHYMELTWRNIDDPNDSNP